MKRRVVIAGAGVRGLCFARGMLEKLVNIPSGWLFMTPTPPGCRVSTTC